MNKLTRTAVGVLTVAAVLAPISASAPAQAAAPGKDWTTLQTLNRAKQQACKVTTTDGNAWRIFNRVNARLLAEGRVVATLTASRGGDGPTREWTSGWVRHGAISPVGAINVPKRGGWALSMGISGGEFGDGGDLTVAQIGRC
ncbi:hypothetical protein [Nocardioides bizhenqiangii]|uniref:Secreted protein n=1 Tax=Nocardioides bizhenqiangii TaxID=3095076 RepID=A0ABZ0ZUG0_9ACTN|nr:MULTISPECIES: hypothetical protein [unclassified Nocardioides]MDZ5622975.1 hypothetical protein [Nocardioides sp. HM23]WQQ27958.1 hypothetical protein SHK19_06910 [Nocardioides sp. HM61]